MNGKRDCEKLMNTLLPFAERMLTEFREFYPYGGYMKPTGEITHVGARHEKIDHPASADLLRVLRESLSEMAAGGVCKASAIVFDVSVAPPGSKEKGDAVQMCLEHADGYTAEVFFPYKIDQHGRVSYGTVFAQEGKHVIFGTTTE
jgi:hypothetical protein